MLATFLAKVRPQEQHHSRTSRMVWDAFMSMTLVGGMVHNDVG